MGAGILTLTPMLVNRPSWKGEEQDGSKQARQNRACT